MTDSCDMKGQSETAAIRGAFKALRRLRRGRAAAKFHAWCEAVFGGLAVVFGLFSFVSLLAGVGLLTLAWRDFKWSRELGRLNPRAASALAQNQILLIGGVVAYCAWQTYAGLTDPGVLERYPELRQMWSEAEAGELDSLWRTAVIATYATVAGLSAVVQGAAAWWFWSMRRAIEATRGALEGDGGSGVRSRAA